MNFLLLQRSTITDSVIRDNIGNDQNITNKVTQETLSIFASRKVPAFPGAT